LSDDRAFHSHSSNSRDLRALPGEAVVYRADLDLHVDQRATSDFNPIQAGVNTSSRPPMPSRAAQAIVRLRMN